MSVFIDTGGWISVLVAKDKYHQVGAAFYKELLDKKEFIYSSNYILDETITRIRYDVSHQEAVQFCNIINLAIKDGFLHLLWVDEGVSRDAEKLFRKYSDQKFSFTDCTTFVLARRTKTKRIFTYDSHFAVLGFQVVPPGF